MMFRASELIETSDDGFTHVTRSDAPGYVGIVYRRWWWLLHPDGTVKGLEASDYPSALAAARRAMKAAALSIGRVN